MPSKPISIALTAYVVLALVVLTLLAVVSLLPVAFAARLVTGWSWSRLTRAGIELYGWCLITAMRPFVPLRVDLQGEARTPCVVVANHASLFDLYYLAAARIDNICLVIREWPFRIPVYNLFMRAARYINSERGGWEVLVERSRKELAAGAAVVVFPEGHRTRDGSPGRFHSGAFRIAIEANVPVVPVCFHGTHRLLSPGRKLLRPSSVIVRRLSPIDPEPYAGREDGHIELRKTVKRRMLLALQEMRAEQEAH